MDAPHPFAALKSHSVTVASFLKLVANSNRLLVLCRLSGGEACVSELEEELNLSQPALSQHLARLRQEGVLETRRDGQQIYYSISDPRIERMLPFLQEMAATLDEPTP
jgi:DNA-binding transcriptional ArsR family regulator